MKITVINYGLSNLLSVQRAFEHFGAEVEITGAAADIAAARALLGRDDGRNRRRAMGGPA